MSRRCSLVLLPLLLATSLVAGDQALWREYGLVHTETTKQGKLAITKYEMKDLTGGVAAWESLRSAGANSCDLAPFCTDEGNRIVIGEDNYVVVFSGARPTKAQVSDVLSGLPNKRDTSLPAIFTFLPRQGLVPNSARYILGPVSLKAFAPELADARPGFEQGAEAQAADYSVGKSGAPVRLVIFYYPTPEMARLEAINFKLLSGMRVKRSGVLLAVVSRHATDQQADTLLARVEYEAKITWNDVPPPSPIKPLYQLLLNILYLSIALSALCLLAGLIYAAMRIYRRKYGTLEADEAMTTLHLT